MGLYAKFLSSRLEERWKLARDPATKFNHKHFFFGKEDDDIRYVHNLPIIVVLIPPILVALERQVQRLVFNKVQIRRDLLLDLPPPKQKVPLGAMSVHLFVGHCLVRLIVGHC